MKRISYFLFGLVILSSCKKESETQSYEDFAISGTVNSCITGQPIQGAKITLTVKHLDNGGFFNSSKFGGETYSDNEGKYRITPYQITNITDVSMVIQKEQYFSEFASIYVTALKQAHATVSIQDFYLGQPAYLKVRLNSIYPTTDSDYLTIDAHSSGACGNANAMYLNSYPAPADSFIGTKVFKGNIQNGFIEFQTNGNDSGGYYYNTHRAGKYDSLRLVRFYCRVHDTTFLDLDY